MLLVDNSRTKVFCLSWREGLCRNIFRLEVYISEVWCKINRAAIRWLKINPTGYCGPRLPGGWVTCTFTCWYCLEIICSDWVWPLFWLVWSLSFECHSFVMKSWMTSHCSIKRTTTFSCLWRLIDWWQSGLPSVEGWVTLKLVTYITTKWSFTCLTLLIICICPLLWSRTYRPLLVPHWWSLLVARVISFPLATVTDLVFGVCVRVYY